MEKKSSLNIDRKIRQIEQCATDRVIACLLGLCVGSRSLRALHMHNSSRQCEISARPTWLWKEIEEMVGGRVEVLKRGEKRNAQWWIRIRMNGALEIIYHGPYAKKTPDSLSRFKKRNVWK